MIPNWLDRTGRVTRSRSLGRADVDPPMNFEAIEISLDRERDEVKFRERKGVHTRD